MSAFGAWLDGIRRVNRAPAILLGVWALTLLVSVPLALALRGMLAQHLGASLAADTAASGVNYDWMQEFSDQASGLGTTFKPTIIGFGAVLDNLSAFLDDTQRPVVIVGAASVYIVLWIFVAGGIIDRYARDRATRAFGFFAGAGEFFFRFLRLAVVQWIVYAVLFGALHPLAVRQRCIRALTREMTRRAHGVRDSRRCCTWCSARLVAVVHDDLRLREGAGGRRGSAQHAGRDWRRGRASSAATPARRSLLFLLNFGAFAGGARRCTRSSRRAPGSAGLIDVARRRAWDRSTCWPGSG